jgi:hypothetical protein
MCSGCPRQAGELALRVGTYVNKRARGPRLNHAITASHNAEESIQGATCADHECTGFRRVPRRSSGSRQRSKRFAGGAGCPTDRARDKAASFRRSIVGDISGGRDALASNDSSAHRAETFSFARRSAKAGRARAQSLIHFCAQSIGPAATDLVRRNPVWRRRRGPCALVARRSGKQYLRAGVALYRSELQQSLDDVCRGQWAQSIKLGLSGVEPLGALDLKAVFKLETGFQPTTGRLTDGPKSLIDNNGRANADKVTAGDSARAGQPFQGAAFGGVSSAMLGTLTFGRQNSLDGRRPS